MRNVIRSLQPAHKMIAGVSPLAACQEEESWASAGIITAIGSVSGKLCIMVANDATGKLCWILYA